MNNGRDCEHGQLARSCDRCEDAAEITRLRAELAEAKREAWERERERDISQGNAEMHRLAAQALTAERASLRAEVESLRADAGRYRWLSERLLAADFDYNGEGVTALVFEMPPRTEVSADCSDTIDAAIAAQKEPTDGN